MVQISIYDAQTIDTLPWPDTEEGRQARDFLLPMVKEGVQTFIRNVDTKLFVLLVDQKVIPITVNAQEYDNSYLTSNYFPIKYMEEKWGQKPSWFNQLKSRCIQGAGYLLKGVKINKAVIVNNWLLTTNIYPQLTVPEVEAVTQFLTVRFPDHTLFFRSLNTRKCQDLVGHLSQLKYRLFYARHVCIYDPQEKSHFSSKVHYHHRRDRKLIESEGYEVVRYKAIPAEEEQRVMELYKSLYLDRHTIFSPQYTKKYLQQALQKNFLHLVGLKKEGKVQGVIGFHERQGTLIAPFCGYNSSEEGSAHLYRMLTILAIDEAESRGTLLNDGSGGEAPKKYRGMKTFPEYVALYDRHLPIYRRLFWGIAEKATRTFQKSSSKQATSELSPS